ncbi:hypothetical protein ABFX02_14G298700 [Erythranthe guttata]
MGFLKPKVTTTNNLQKLKTPMAPAPAPVGGSFKTKIRGNVLTKKSWVIIRGSVTENLNTPSSAGGDRFHGFMVLPMHFDGQIFCRDRGENKPCYCSLKCMLMSLRVLSMNSKLRRCPYEGAFTLQN